MFCIPVIYISSLSNSRPNPECVTLPNLRYGGNTWEWTSEERNSDINPCTDRGGSYHNSSVEYPAAVRNYRTRSFARDNISFRTTLYL